MPVVPTPVIKEEKGLNISREENAQKDPYSLSLPPLKLKVKIETPPEQVLTADQPKDLLGESSMFERILKSISGEKEEEAGGPYEAEREEMLRAVEEEESEEDTDSSEDSDSEDSDSEEEDSVPQVMSISAL